MKHLINKLKLETYVFIGIIEFNKLFVQVATKDNEVAYASRVEIPFQPSLNELMSAIKDLFPAESYKKSGIKVTNLKFCIKDGKRIGSSIEKSIMSCRSITTLYPLNSTEIFAHIQKCMTTNGYY